MYTICKQCFLYKYICLKLELRLYVTRSSLTIVLIQEAEVHHNYSVGSLDKSVLRYILQRLTQHNNYGIVSTPSPT